MIQVPSGYLMYTAIVSNMTYLHMPQQAVERCTGDVSEPRLFLGFATSA